MLLRCGRGKELEASLWWLFEFTTNFQLEGARRCQFWVNFLDSSQPCPSDPICLIVGARYLVTKAVGNSQHLRRTVSILSIFKEIRSLRFQSLSSSPSSSPVALTSKYRAIDLTFYDYRGMLMDLKYNFSQSASMMIKSSCWGQT